MEQTAWRRRERGGFDNSLAALDGPGNKTIGQRGVLRRSYKNSPLPSKFNTQLIEVVDFDGKIVL